MADSKMLKSKNKKYACELYFFIKNMAIFLMNDRQSSPLEVKILLFHLSFKIANQNLKDKIRTSIF